MPVLLEYAPWIMAMGILILASAFFSSSEAAFFYLTERQRRRLASGNRAQRVAAGLLDDPERLLTAVLFLNLIVNVTYFAIGAIASLNMQEAGDAAAAGWFAVGSLLAIIILSEMLPKSLAVLQPRMVATLVGIPLAATVRAIDPILPGLRLANLLSRRVLWPTFQPEPYLQLGDLERAVELSTTDAALLEQEQTVLQNIVLLSDIRADELMRPRTQFLSFRPPVALADLGGQLPPSGYLLVTEPDSDEVAAAIGLRRLSDIPSENLEEHADAVVYVPWCTTVSEVLETMQRGGHQVAAVVNEFGETIGILTFDDILDTIFSRASSRSERLLQRVPIRRVMPDVWHVTGMTSLRRLGRHFDVRLPSSKSLTVAGVVQETLERMPKQGDECRWGPFGLRVLEVTQRGEMTVELRRIVDSREDSP